MTGKNTGYSLILIASFVLLAHAVIPHHYHQNQICFLKNHKTSDASYPVDLQTEHNHQNNKGSDPDLCFSSEFIPASSDHDYRLHIYNDSDDNNTTDIQFLNYSNPDISTFLTGVNIIIPDIVPFYSLVFSSSLGLRAPPV